MGVRGSRRFRFRGAIALVGVAALAIAMGACGSTEESTNPEAVVERFTELLDKHDYAAAAELTSYPSGASATLRQMYEGLDSGNVDFEKSQFIGLDDETGLFTLDAAWNFGKNKDWRYSREGKVRKLAVGWRISWEPSVVMPELTHDRSVHLVRTTPDPPPSVVDIAGEPLMAEQTLNVIKLDPARMPDHVASTEALADAIEPVASSITAQSLQQELASSHGKPIVAVTLRDGDFNILESRMGSIPGVVMEKEPRLISADRRVQSPLLDGLHKVWQESQDQHSGWAVQLFENGEFSSQLAGAQQPAGPDIASTIDQRLQRAAQDAAVSVGTPASIVAVQPSSGAVVAAAQNSYANEHGPVAFTGLYPFGGNIELLRAVAASRTGKPVREVSPAEAAEAAGMLGIGVDFHVPGLDEVTGRLVTPGSTEPVRRGSGSDAVLASPFGMAIAAATIQRGSVPVPMIERGRSGETSAELDPLPASVSNELRTMLGESMREPRLAELRMYRNVAGFAADAGKDGWLIATMGDLAFAIHIKDSDSGDTAARVANRMLRAYATPEP